MGLEDHLHSLQGRYIQAPQWVRSLLGAGYAALPQSLRHGAAYSRFAAEAACADAAQVSAAASEKLAATLNTALRLVPAFRRYRYLLDQIADPLQCLALLPMTSKEDIKRAPHAYRSTAAAARGLRAFTGGSTAQPLEFLLEKHVTRARETAYVDYINSHILGLGARDLTLSLHGRTVGSAARAGGRIWMYEPIKRQLIFSSDHLERRYMPAYVEVLRRRRPSQIHAYPSALLPLSRWLAEQPCTEFTDSVRGILLTSENVYPPQLQLFRRVFPRARIVRHYGHSERVLMAVAVDDTSGYRFLPLYGHLELVDASGRRIDEPGLPGEIVGTSFDNHVMPFVRYRTGDLGVWGASGAMMPATLESVEGRLQEFVVCKDSRLVSVTTLGAAHFAELAVADCLQYEQRQPGLVEVNVVAPRTLYAEEISCISDAVRRKTQGGCTAQVLQVDRIERTVRGKHRMLIQHLDLSRYFGAGAVAATPPAD